MAIGGKGFYMSLEIIALIIMSGVLTAVLIAYGLTVGKLNRLRKEQEELDARTRQQAVKIVESAKDRALDILENTKIDARESQEEIDKKLHDITQKQIEYYKEMMLNISENLKDDAKKMLQMQTTGAQNTVIQKIEDDYAAARDQVEAYKQERMKLIDAKSAEIMKEFTRIALGRVWSNEEQQELIMAALEEAKKQHVF